MVLETKISPNSNTFHFIVRDSDNKIPYDKILKEYF